MPALMARICGICPVSHLIASAKTCEEIMAVSIPPVAVNLRRVMNLAQMVQSHALSFFHLSSPDLLLGFDADAAGRNFLGVAAAAPQLHSTVWQCESSANRSSSGSAASGSTPDGSCLVASATHWSRRSATRFLAGIPDALERIRRTLSCTRQTSQIGQTKQPYLPTSRRCTWALCMRTATSPSPTVTCE